MKITAKTPDEYVNLLDENRQKIFQQLRKVIKKNLPKGFVETISYGSIGYVVPHDIYPKGYHCDPKLPLPFINIASQKNHISIHHLGIYASKELCGWFDAEYKKQYTSKLDLGKGCIRFKEKDNIPYDLIGQLVTKISVDEWIKMYEKAFCKK